MKFNDAKPDIWILEPLPLPCCFGGFLNPMTKQRGKDAERKFVVVRTAQPEALWVAEYAPKLYVLITSGQLKAGELLNARAKNCIRLEAETTDDARRLLEERGFVFRNPPFNELQRGILCVTQWQSWSILDHLPSLSFDWWGQAFCCKWSPSTLGKLKALSDASPYTMGTLWRAQQGISVEAIRRFVDLYSPAKQKTVLRAASIDPNDDSGDALLRASLRFGDPSGESIGHVIKATVDAWEAHGEEAVAMAVYRLITRFLKDINKTIAEKKA